MRISSERGNAWQRDSNDTSGLLRSVIMASLPRVLDEIDN